MKQTNLTLKESGYYGVGIYDNSQCQQSIKFQHGSHSSSVTKTTSRLFIEPFIPPHLEDMAKLQDQPEIKYIDQPIPSPYMVMCFDDARFNDPTVAINHYSESFETSVDITGNRVGMQT